MITTNKVVYDPILKGIYNREVEAEKRKDVVYDPILKGIYNGSIMSMG